ncbi:MAG: serine hydrolase domain-containing protein [Pseudomonadota bacterium]
MTIRFKSTRSGLGGRLALLAAILALLWQAPVAGAATDYSEVIKDLERDIRRTMRGEDIAGAALVLIDGQRVVHERAYGEASADDERRMTTTTPMLVGDFSKIPATIAVLQLVAAGKVDLEAPVTDYLDLTFSGRAANERPPLVRELLTHHSGLAPNRFAGSFGPVQPMGITLIEPLPRTQPPGVIYSYSQLGFQVLAALVEKVSGRPYVDYVAEAVLGPLELTDAGFVATAATAQPHDRKGRQKDAVFPRELGALGLFASIRDLGKLLRWVLAGEGAPVMTDALFGEMTREQNADIPLDLDNRVALGWQMTNTGNHKVDRLLRLYSGTFRHRGLILIAPEEQLAVALIANSSAASEFVPETAAEALDLMLEAKLGREPPDEDPELPERLALPSGAAARAMEPRYSTPLGELQLEGDESRYEMELVGRKFGAKLREDGWYEISFKLFGVISLRFSVLAEVLIRPATLGGQSVLLAHFRGSDLLFGTGLEDIPPAPELEAWAGRYRIANPDLIIENLEIETVDLVFDEGLLYLEYEIPSTTIAVEPRVPLVPFGPDRLYVPGLGINTGDTIALGRFEGRRTLTFSGWQLVEER